MKTDSKEINWGIIGCGKIAHKFAQDLRCLDNAKLQAVASRSIEKSTAFGKEHNASNYYDSYESLCADPLVDVIYIATPHSFHFEHTMLCLDQGKAVLCEKPFAMNANQVAQMIDLAKEKNVFLMEAMWTYFLPHYQYVLNLIQSKELGEITHLKADFGYQFDFDPESRVYNKRLGGGSLLDIGIYPVFAALSMLGKPNVIEANATMSITEVDENCKVIFNYDNDVQAELYSSIVEETPTEAIIKFEKGSVKIHSGFQEPSSITIYRNGTIEQKMFQVETNGYNFEASHVQEMLLGNLKESSIMSFETSLDLMNLLDSIRAKIGLEY